MSEAHAERDAAARTERPAGDPIAITGVGIVSALGSDRESAWRAFHDGDQSGVRVLAAGDPRRERTSDASPLPDAGRAGWVRGFRPREQVTSPQLRRMDWGSRMLVAATRQAFGDAGLLDDAGRLDEATREAAAIVAGSCFGNQRETATYLERVFTAGLGAGQPMLFPNLVLNAAGGYAAIELGIEGPNLSLSQHEASGEAALAAAVDLLEAGACELACAGGFDELGRVYLDALADRRLLHPDSLAPERAERARRSGRGLRGAIVPGEGAAMLLLEPLARARARGARVYGVLACARTGAVPGPAHLLARDAEAAARRLVELAAPAGPVSAVFGCADGSEARAAIDAAVMRAIADRQESAPAYVAFRTGCGDFGAAGAVGAVLATLAVASAGVPAAAISTTAPGDVAASRALVVGAARGGLVAPVVVEA